MFLFVFISFFFNNLFFKFFDDFQSLVFFCLKYLICRCQLSKILHLSNHFLSLFQQILFFVTLPFNFIDHIVYFAIFLVELYCKHRILIFELFYILSHKFFIILQYILTFLQELQLFDHFFALFKLCFVYCRNFLFLQLQINYLKFLYLILSFQCIINILEMILSG